MDTELWPAIVGAVVGAGVAFAVNVWWSRYTAPRPAWMLRIDHQERSGDVVSWYFRVANCGAGPAFGVTLEGVETERFDETATETVPMVAAGQPLISWDTHPTPGEIQALGAETKSRQAGVRIWWSESQARTRKRQSTVLRFTDYPSPPDSPTVW